MGHKLFSVVDQWMESQVEKLNKSLPINLLRTKYEIDHGGNIVLCFTQFIISTVNITVIVLEDRFFKKVFFWGAWLRVYMGE